MEQSGRVFRFHISQESLREQTRFGVAASLNSFRISEFQQSDRYFDFSLILRSIRTRTTRFDPSGPSQYPADGWLPQQDLCAGEEFAITPTLVRQANQGLDRIIAVALPSDVCARHSTCSPTMGSPQSRKPTLAELVPAPSVGGIV